MTSRPRSPMSRYKILIVDDHPVMRRGLAQAINEEENIEVCGEAADMMEALRQVEATRPDVVIIDLGLGGEDGIELIDYIKSRWPSVKMLVCSARDEQTYAGRVLRAGAQGYISKLEASSKIVAALHQVLRGEVYLSTQMANCLLQRAAVGQALDSDPVTTLSDRELQVFEMIGDGLTTQEIAQKLRVSPKTVESHRRLIKRKLHLQNGAQLCRCAFQWVQEGHRSTRS